MGESDRVARAIPRSVRAAIKESGRSSRDVAQCAGISLRVLNSRLSGRHPFLITELAAIADVLEVPLAELISRAASTAESIVDQADRSA